MTVRGCWETGEGRTAVRCELYLLGDDPLLVVTGGGAHVGAVATALPPIAGGGVELTVVPGHREGDLAREGARLLARASGRTAVVVVGIHQDGATPAEIAGIVAAVREGFARAAAVFRAAEADQR